MAYFYVKSGGTAAAATDAGRYASQQSGSFASLGAANYYGKLADAFAAATPPAGGDFVCISDSHSYSSTTAVSLSISGSSLSPCTITTVSDSNCNVAAIASAAQESVTGGTSDILLTGNSVNYFLYGLWLKSDDDINIANTSGQCNLAVNCTFQMTAANDSFFAGGDGTACKLIDCTVMADVVYHYNGAIVNYVGGSVVDGAGGTLTALNNAPFFGGGTVSSYEGTDCTQCLSLIGTSNTGTNNDTFRMKLSRCKLYSSVAFVEAGDTLERGDLLEVYQSGSDSSAEYQFYYRDGECIAEEDTAFYRNSSYAFPISGQKISIKVSTNAHVGPLMPFVIPLPLTYMDLTNSGSDALKFHILSSSSLTDADVFIELVYPDGTNKHIPNNAYSVATALAPFRTGTTLTTNTESWTGRTTENRYEITVSTASDPGAKSVPKARLFVTKPSTTFYFCSTPETI